MIPKEKKKKKEKKPEAEGFSTKDNALVQSLTSKGFHVSQQIVVDGGLLYIFKESKREIEGKKEGNDE